MVAVLPLGSAQILLHGLVESPYVIDFAPIIVAQNSLTKFLKRVDSQSFFDISNVFPIGGQSGIRVKGHRRTAQAGNGVGWKRRRAGKDLAADCWSRRTGNVQRQYRSPEALTDLPGWW